VVEPPSAPEKASVKQPSGKGEKKAEKLTAIVVHQEQATPPPPPPKERNKKKRSELATLQQMSEYKLMFLHEFCCL